jgi:hypothetical protein
LARQSAGIIGPHLTLRGDCRKVWSDAVTAIGGCRSLLGRIFYPAKQQQAAQVRQDQSFKGWQFTAEVILWARLAKGSVRPSRMEGQGEGVRWYLMFPDSYRDLELMLQDRGVEVAHTTIFRWTQAYAA